MSTIKTTITDHQGRSYDFQIYEDEIRIELSLQDHRSFITVYVGRLQGIFDPPDKLHLGDIVIWNSPVFFPRGLGKLVPRRFWLKRIENYRRRGLGSQMLRTLIDRAQQRGIKQIYGYVMDNDPDNDSSPLPWYQRHGFHIVRHREQYQDTLIALELDSDLDEKS